jgi:hypothetical protein
VILPKESEGFERISSKRLEESLIRTNSFENSAVKTESVLNIDFFLNAQNMSDEKEKDFIDSKLTVISEEPI